MIFLLKQDLFIAMEYGYLTIHLLFTFCNIYSVSEHTLLIMMRCASSEHSTCQQSGWSSVYIRIIWTWHKRTGLVLIYAWWMMYLTSCVRWLCLWHTSGTWSCLQCLCFLMAGLGTAFLLNCALKVFMQPICLSVCPVPAVNLIASDVIYCMSNSCTKNQGWRSPRSAVAEMLCGVCL